ncbi:MAG: CZB domain-containing protein, partial [Mariprofundaceae bacterium]|nr:CZB domain-containing protein [Mariprofundaceae bacterium]
IFNQLLDARVAHLRWVARAEALVEGVPLAKEQVPLLASDCDFGHWYLGRGRVLRHLPSYDSVGTHHDHLHRVYMDIFTRLYSEEERQNILQWLGIQRTVHQSNQDKARELIPQLKEASDAVLSAMNQLTLEFQQYLKVNGKGRSHPDSTLDQLYHELKDMGYARKSS